jgi:hypothetical protein
VILLIVLIFLVIGLNKITFSETVVTVKDSDGKLMQNTKLDMMYYCEDYSFKNFGVIPGETNEKGEVMFPAVEGFTFKKEDSCRKTLTLLENNLKFLDGGATYRLDIQDTEEEIIVK